MEASATEASDSGPKLTKQQRKRRNKKLKKQAEKSGATPSEDDAPDLSRSESMSTNGDDTVDSSGNKISRSRARKLRRQRQKQRQQQDGDGDGTEELSGEMNTEKKVENNTGMNGHGSRAAGKEAPRATAPETTIDSIKGPAEMPIPETKELDKAAIAAPKEEAPKSSNASATTLPSEGSLTGVQKDTSADIKMPDEPKLQARSAVADRKADAPAPAKKKATSTKDAATATKGKSAGTATQASVQANGIQPGKADDRAPAARNIPQNAPPQQTKPAEQAPLPLKSDRAARAYADEDKKEKSDNCDCAGCVVS
mmetsp:Transcript_55659/g.161282  ORF Transcript_55659/g.161282 Transcript_55659/m.161282 type:complete len:312 (+) Transcript_55659:217-1152(+)